MHALVLIALIPTSLVLLIRFFSAQNNHNRLFVATDATVVAAVARLLWVPISWAPSAYELLGYTALLAAMLLFLIVRWLRARSPTTNSDTKDP